MVRNLQCRRPEFDSWVRMIPQRREWLPSPVFWPREFHGQGSLQAIVHGVAKNWTRLSNFTSLQGSMAFDTLLEKRHYLSSLPLVLNWLLCIVGYSINSGLVSKCVLLCYFPRKEATVLQFSHFYSWFKCFFTKKKRIYMRKESKRVDICMCIYMCIYTCVYIYIIKLNHFTIQ